MQYYISSSKPYTRYIEIKAILSGIDADTVAIQLPSWRPGRYELGNFAKNVRRFSVKDYTGFEIPFQKVTKDRWIVETRGRETIEITYEYFASELNAGSSYTDTDLLYINPVNCLVYAEGFQDKPCELHLLVHSDFKVGCQLHKINEQSLQAPNFDALADSPVLASPNLEHHHVEVDNTTHHIWIYGHHLLNIEKLLKDISVYSHETLSIFREMEGKEYHYLYLFTPGRFRHGVEHANSTVIAMGPSAELHLEPYYHSLLAISSHEFFHFWNVKRIRPADMWPYDLTRENYSRLGYVYEGVTTYYGDYLLLRSGIWAFEQWSHEFSGDLQKHLHNQGRFNYSVAESSFDTWLDGYTSGSPGRKVSIYTEGMLAAFMLDMELRHATQSKRSLDDVMRALYQEYYKKGRGYTEANFLSCINQVGGKDFSYFFRDFYEGRGKIEEFLPESLFSIGLEIKMQPSPFVHEGLLGFTILRQNGGLIVTDIANGSPAVHAGLAFNDCIMAVDGEAVRTVEELETLLRKDLKRSYIFHIKDVLREKKLILEAGSGKYYEECHVVKSANATPEQKEFYKRWCGQEF